jgi:hypothetical protein
METHLRSIEMLPRSVLSLQTSQPASSSTKQLGAQQMRGLSIHPLFLRFDLYAFFFRIKFVVLSVVKNDPLNARRCDNHGLKLRRKHLQ